MLGEYRVGRCTRKCFAEDRPLRDGEWYYSVVVETDEGFERRDYSAQAWKGPPEEAIGWWKNRIPTADEKKMVLAPPEVLVDVLRQMERFPERAKTRYLLALMMMRKKILKPVYDDRAALRHATGDQSLVVQVVSTGEKIEITQMDISRGESETLKDQLLELLYCEAEESDQVESDQASDPSG